jgi:predicted peptidase/TPR repeat protein
MKLHPLNMFVITIAMFSSSVYANQSPHPPMSEFMKQYESANSAGNDAQAFRILKNAVKQQDPEALARLGDAYIHGRYGLNTPAKAYPYIKQAADLGNARGMTDLGILYLNGSGIKKNYPQARSWFEKAAVAGDIKAPRYLGIIYENGWGTAVDYKKAFDNYQSAANHGDISAQYYLGQLYEKGLGVKQDFEQAFTLYQQSATRGDIVSEPAMMALGHLYENGLGIKKNTRSALDLYLKSAALGDQQAKDKVALYQFPENPFVMNVTSLVKVLGDGQKVAGIAIEYKNPIQASSVNLNDFQVPDREIEAVYVNDQAELTKAPKAGNFVIVQLKTEIDKNSSNMGGGPERHSNSTPDKQQTGHDSPPAGGGPQLGQVSDKPASPVILSSNIIQSGEIITTTGQSVAGSSNEMVSNHTINPDIQGFRQLVFHDEKTGKNLMYNLYIPQNYNPAKKYPLVMFIHDAGAVSNNHIETLTQGTGAIVWASKEDQQKHESFVLAPQFNTVIVGDSSKTTVDVDVAVNLLKSLMKQYNIDANRLYNTGQSMGGMTSISLNIKYPDLFAASFLVACQWDPNLVEPMAKKALWIVVSEGDTKAHPGMDAITSALAKHGATVTKATWHAEAAPTVLANSVKMMRKENASVNYTTFAGGNHTYTWEYAYSISGIRDWLFEQHK